jgi:hypothetical protein
MKLSAVSFPLIVMNRINPFALMADIRFRLWRAPVVRTTGVFRLFGNRW